MSASQQTRLVGEWGRWDRLTNAERDAYEAVEYEGYGVREYARRTGRSPGTLSNLLRRARAKLGEDRR